MTNEDNDKAQLMRDKARENAAFYYPKTVEGLEAAMKTMAEAHHTALEVERQKKDYFNQDNQRLKAELERACDKLEVERAKVRELEAQLAHAQAAVKQFVIAVTDTKVFFALGGEATPDLKLAGELAKKCDLSFTEGWLSPDEAKALQAQCAAMRGTLILLSKLGHELDEHLDEAHPIQITFTEFFGAFHNALSTAGQELLSRLERYEKALSDLVADCEHIVKGGLSYSIIVQQGRWRTLELARETLKGPQ